MRTWLHLLLRAAFSRLSQSIAGIDFETRLFAKVNAAEKLREELARPGYVCSTITIGANTDPYQPAERDWKITTLHSGGDG
jgi:DNA repair photolyase